MVAASRVVEVERVLLVFTTAQHLASHGRTKLGQTWSDYSAVYCESSYKLSCQLSCEPSYVN